jgi:hypothetical protein
MPKVTLYEFVADIRVSIVIAAESESNAKAKIANWDVGCWLADGEKIGVNDVDLLDVRTVDCDDVYDVAHIDARDEAVPCQE